MSKDINKETRSSRAGFLFYLKKLFSYLWPIHVDSFETETDYLQLELYQGKLQLNGREANYSYGNLQRAFKSFFVQSDISWEGIEKVLILGFGLGGVVDLINQRKKDLKIVGVEINPQIISWHNNHFIREGVTVVHQDAFSYMENCKEQYDIIVVDVYEELEVPLEFHSREFVQNLFNQLSNSGVLIFNKVVSNEAQRGEFGELIALIGGKFKRTTTNIQQQINYIIAAYKT